jgi:hypothetical protein
MGVAWLAGCVTPDHVYLTWQGDTGTTMTVNFHTGDAGVPSRVYYDTQPHAGVLQKYPRHAEGSSKRIPGLKDGRLVHTVELTGLEPGAEYYFALDRGSAAHEWKFRTLPDDGSPLRFVVGGDMGTFPKTWLLMEEAARFDPQFVIVGGDIAYANGELKNAYRWDWWLRRWEKEMRTGDGALIPIVAAIGNHEVNELEGPPEARAPFYFGFLAQGGNPYFVRNFGRDLAIFVLDSGHIAPHDGAQRDWLEGALEQHADFKHKIAVYHVPLYPSHRDFDGRPHVEGRTHWLPLFDAHRIDAAFEHHDHTFKRTVPLRGGVPTPGGTVYLGDGSFGVPSRNIEQGAQGYLAAAAGKGHFWVVDLDASGLRYRAVDRHGDVFDKWPAEAGATEPLSN